MTASFQIKVAPKIHFGMSASQQLSTILGNKVHHILFLRGRSGIASAAIADDLSHSFASLHEAAIPGEPSIDTINRLFAQFKGQPLDAMVACGGGAVIDAAKALRFCLVTQKPLPQKLEHAGADHWNGANDMPLIAIPTTAGTGAEVTANAVLQTGNAKTSLRGDCLCPSTALVDPRLLSSAPQSVVIGAGLDAVVQLMEAFTSCKATPYSDALVLSHLTAAPAALHRVVENPQDDDWTAMAWASLSSGLALTNGGLGAAHGLAAVLGGHLNAPHGLLCGRLFGPVLLKNRASATVGSQAHGRTSRCIAILNDVFSKYGSAHDLEGFEAWLTRHGVPRLSDWGLETANFDAIAHQAVTASSSTKNPVPLTQPDFRAVLEAAY